MDNNKWDVFMRHAHCTVSISSPAVCPALAWLYTALHSQSIKAHLYSAINPHLRQRAAHAETHNKMLRQETVLKQTQTTN